jgi:hypothetical protein
MLDKLRQRTIAQQIERIVSDASFVELTHEAFILLDVDGIAEVILTDERSNFDENEEFDLDFTKEDFATIMNECVKEPMYSYFDDGSRLTLRRDLNKISDEVYELNFKYKLELKGSKFKICKDGVHYDVEKDESPYQKYELIDKIAEVYNVDAVGLIDQIDYEPCLASLNFIKDYLEDASEVDIYDIIGEHLSVVDLWSDLIAASNSPRYDGSVFETSQSFLINSSSV